MDINGNHSFEVDEVIDVIETGVDVGTKIRNNPKFKIIQSDIPYDEAMSLMEPEYDIFMNAVKQRSKSLQTRDLLAKEIEMDRSEVIERTIVKVPETFEQTEDVIVG